MLLFLTFSASIAPACSWPGLHTHSATDDWRLTKKQNRQSQVKRARRALARRGVTPGACTANEPWPQGLNIYFKVSL